jgi:DNA-binding transcriptional regulator YhcF (GntR family)
MMLASIDHGSGIAPFEQLRRQIMTAIDSGRMAPGVRLPSVRQLALDLDLAPNTVAKTIRELELAGYVETRGRNGTVVAYRAPKTQQDLRRDLAVGAATYVHVVTELGFSRTEALLAFEAAFAAASLL